MSTTLTIEGMSCEHCEQRVADALSEVEGVTDVTVDREAESAAVAGDAEESELVAAVDEAGYTAHPERAVHSVDSSVARNASSVA